MDPRSIDFAKTASVDMMTLNNKVVNMRQVVKRTKVHVISKLCKHIQKLKNKKGTEEQKAKNLKKAERLIEEINSIKKLKEDKVSKYALANTTSFSDVSKISLLPGPRALARLAEHPLMRRIVDDFRDKHSDWRELAAYLLVKQTGRRFKTKKQKQKKLARCIENINASETMTKAYIKERFGQEGLTKAEQRFERKRKRQKSTVNADSSLGNNVNTPENKQKIEANSCVDEREESPVKNEKQEKMSVKMLENVEVFTTEKDQSKHGTERKHHKSLHMFDHSDIQRQIADCSVFSQLDSSSSSENRNKDIEHSDNSNDKIADVPDKGTSDLDMATVKVKTRERNECVVKELKLEAASGTSFSSDDDANDANDSHNNRGLNKSIGDSHGNDDDEKNIREDENTHKYRKQQKQHIPEFVTTANKTKLLDPFFAISDDDDDNGNLEDDISIDVHGGDDSFSDVDMNYKNFKAKSMFYNPNSHGQVRPSTWRSHSVTGVRGNCDRKTDLGRFNVMQRGRSFRGGDRGRSFRGGDRGRSFRGGDRGRSFRGGSYNRSSSLEISDQFTRKKTLNKRTSSDRYMGAETQARKTRHGGDMDIESETRHAFSVGPVVNEPPQEKLHPSWEASKKRRAEQSGITAFQGSKMTFDDDDD